jgi:hypothetical protein
MGGVSSTKNGGKEEYIGRILLRKPERKGPTGKTKTYVSK